MAEHGSIKPRALLDDPASHKSGDPADIYEILSGVRRASVN
jgi:hypothetical protein